MRLAWQNRVIKLDILWVVNESDMQYTRITNRKKILGEILISNPNIIVFKTNFRPRLKVISKKKGHHLKSLLGNALFCSRNALIYKKKSHHLTGPLREKNVLVRYLFWAPFPTLVIYR